MNSEILTRCDSIFHNHNPEEYTWQQFCFLNRKASIVYSFNDLIRNNFEEVSKTRHWSDFQRHCPALVEDIMAKKPASWII